MNLDEYVRQEVRDAPLRQRNAAAQALRSELNELVAEAVADGTPWDAAVRQAIELHSLHERRKLNPWRLRAFLTAPASTWTWRGVAYIAALFPVGLVSFIWAVGGGGVIIGSLLLIVGVFLAIPFLLTLPALGRVHATLASWATGQPMPLIQTQVRTEGTRLQRILQHAQDPQIAFSLLSCLVAFAFGQIGFGLLVGIASGIVFMVTAPFTSDIPPMPGGGAIYPAWMLENEWFMSLAGIAMFWIWAWSAQAISWLSARVTRGVLTRS